MRSIKKRVLSSFLAIALALALVPAAMAVDYGAENPPERFSDVKSDNWAYEYIEEMAKRGAINGYPDGTFKPKNQVTRVEFAKILVVAGGLVVPDDAKSSFADVRDGNWGVPYIEVSKPYMTYYRSNGQLMFKPKEAAVREDIAVAVVKLKGYDTRSADLAMLEAMFSDADTISESAKPYVALAVENKLISGYTDGTFRGQKTITRAETAAILWRAFQYGSDDKVVDPFESGEPVESAQPSAPEESEKPAQPSAPAESEKPAETERYDLIDGDLLKGDLVEHTRNMERTTSKQGQKAQMGIGGEVIDHWFKWIGLYGEIIVTPNGEYDTLTFTVYSSDEQLINIYNNSDRNAVLGTVLVKANEPTAVTIELHGAVRFEIAKSGGSGNPTYLYNAYLE